LLASLVTEASFSIAGYWQQVGDLGKHGEMTMIKLISNGNKLIAESLARKAAAMTVVAGLNWSATTSGSWGPCSKRCWPGGSRP
jgi:hypothetical protein